MFKAASGQKYRVAKLLVTIEKTGKEITGHAIRGQTAGCAIGTASAAAQTNQNVLNVPMNTALPTTNVTASLLWLIGLALHGRIVGVNRR